MHDLIFEACVKGSSPTISLTACGRDWKSDEQMRYKSLVRARFLRFQVLIQYCDQQR